MRKKFLENFILLDSILSTGQVQVALGNWLGALWAKKKFRGKIRMAAAAAEKKFGKRYVAVGVVN